MRPCFRGLWPLCDYQNASEEGLDSKEQPKTRDNWESNGERAVSNANHKYVKNAGRSIQVKTGQTATVVATQHCRTKGWKDRTDDRILKTKNKHYVQDANTNLPRKTVTRVLNPPHSHHLPRHYYHCHHSLKQP